MSYELWLDCTEPVTGDTIRFTEGVFSGPHYARRKVGDRTVVARIEKESVGAGSGAVSFSLMVVGGEGSDTLPTGSKITRKAATVSRGLRRLIWTDESRRDAALASRSIATRAPRKAPAAPRLRCFAD